MTACVAISAAVVVFITSGTSAASLKLLLDFSVALLVIVLPLQLEALFRIAERAHVREQHARLLEVLEDYPDLLPPLTQIAESSVEALAQSRMRPFKERVPTVLEEASTEMQELAQGRLRTGGGDKTLLLTVFSAAEGLVQGTTDEGDTRWWTEGVGKQFFEQNKAFIKGHRGRKVERIWILEKKPSPETYALIAEHHEAGVHVLVAKAADLDDDLLVNMTMMDGVFLHEDVTNKLRRAGEYLFSENPADLGRARSRFRKISSVATRYSAPSTIDQLFARVNY